jgi:hypothetical protein
MRFIYQLILIMHTLKLDPLQNDCNCRGKVCFLKFTHFHMKMIKLICSLKALNKMGNLFTLATSSMDRK